MNNPNFVNTAIAGIDKIRWEKENTTEDSEKLNSDLYQLIFKDKTDFIIQQVRECILETISSNISIARMWTPNMIEKNVRNTTCYKTLLSTLTITKQLDIDTHDLIEAYFDDTNEILEELRIVSFINFVKLHYITGNDIANVAEISDILFANYNESWIRSKIIERLKTKLNVELE